MKKAEKAPTMSRTHPDYAPAYKTNEKTRQEAISTNRSRRMSSSGKPQVLVPEKMLPPQIRVAYEKDGTYAGTLRHDEKLPDGLVEKLEVRKSEANMKKALSLDPKAPKEGEAKKKVAPVIGPSPILAAAAKAKGATKGPLAPTPKMKPVMPKKPVGMTRSLVDYKDALKKAIMEKVMKTLKKADCPAPPVEIPAPVEKADEVETEEEKKKREEEEAKKSLFSEADLMGETKEIKKSTIDEDASKLYKKSCDEPVSKSDLAAGAQIDAMFKGWFIRQPEEMETTKRGSKIVGHSASGKPRLLSSFVNRTPAVVAQAHKASQSAYGLGGQVRGADAHHDAMKAHLSAAFHSHLSGDSSQAHDHMEMAKEHLDHIGEDKVRGKNKWQERFNDTASYVGWPKKD